MKKLIFVLILIVAVFGAVAMSQAPAAGGARGPAGGAPGVGAPGGGGGIGGGQRAGRGAPAPPATGPIADMVAKFVDAVNKQDAAALNKMVTPDAVLIDEDGHFDPISQWITKLTTTGSKTLTVATGGRVSPLKVFENGDAAWAAFNYNLKETATPRGGTAAPNEMNGTVTITFKKNGADWQATLVHIAVTGLAITPH